jgi:Receptor family ligand binding region.
MLAYDSVYLFANSLETIINQQEDYSNGDTINNALRASDFTGASGSIKISDGTNDRTVIGYSVLNVQNSTLVMIKEYDPLDSFINVTNSIV